MDRDTFVREGMRLRDLDRTPTQGDIDSGEHVKVRLSKLGNGSLTRKSVGRVRGKSF
jgi:hypothetical protein